MIPEKFERRLSLPCYFFDCREQLRPAAFFDIAQDLAMYGAAMVGASDRVLKQRDLAWVLVRMHVHYDRLPSLYEGARVQTWHSGVRGPVFTRDYCMLDQDGGPLVRATSDWALMEISSRSLARSSRIFDILSPEPQSPDKALPEAAPKIVLPQNCTMTPAAEHKVLYSDLDYNGHANNAKYPVWAEDALPEEVTMRRSMSDFYINYNRELHLGDTASLLSCQGTDGSWFVEGVHDGLQSFVTRMVFREEEAPRP